MSRVSASLVALSTHFRGTRPFDRRWLRVPALIGFLLASASASEAQTPPSLTPPVGGDSVAIFPMGAPIKMTVTAQPGTTLAFMCAIHSWMQGKMVVDGEEGGNN